MEKGGGEPSFLLKKFGSKGGGKKHRTSFGKKGGLSYAARKKKEKKGVCGCSHSEKEKGHSRLSGFKWGKKEKKRTVCMEAVGTTKGGAEEKGFLTKRGKK